MFYIVWKRGQDQPIESKHAKVDSSSNNTLDTEKCIVWKEVEELSMKSTLIKDKQSEQYMRKPCRVLLKQVYNSTHSTVGAAKLDLRDYVSCKEPTSIDIHFTKWSRLHLCLFVCMRMYTYVPRCSPILCCYNTSKKKKGIFLFCLCLCFSACFDSNITDICLKATITAVLLDDELMLCQQNQILYMYIIFDFVAKCENEIFQTKGKHILFSTKQTYVQIAQTKRMIA
ncbi:hypothetical protein RFI_12355 [Reticulomyxa filosa]|uniref:C2 NT-type domain-containing protein n=1 Tax=Reticulomyxa filosa TaxID=46433 RepID=X6NGB2_RETFI|nr:hypothetical protein RFI_12355 [Reticulomyxa filosa]|eukprot:ETO24804.1 hypothetical protein RFI_12355 [Reticulomyxa filosa]